MARTDNLTNYLTDIANAIRTKGGTTGEINASQFDTAIANIPSGSGAVTIEKGTYTPEETTETRPYIEFTDTHTEPPDLIYILQVEPYQPSTSSGYGLLAWTYVDFYKAFGITLPRTTNQGTYINSYVQLTCFYQRTATASGTAGTTLTHSSSETGEGNTYPCYYADNGGFHPGVASSITAILQDGFTYKWVAMWFNNKPL